MKRLLWLVVALLLASPAYAQQVTRICFTTNGTNCIPVDASNPFPVNATATVSFPTIGAAVPATGIYNALNVGGTLRGVTGLGLGSTFSQTVAIVDASGAQVTSFGGTNASVGATGAAVPASATYIGIISAGNLTGWTGAVTNAGTFAVQATLAAETTKVIGTVNQGTSPWVVTGAGGTFPITAASGSFASGSMAAGSQVDLLTMRGTKNAGTAAANSILSGGVYNSTPLILTDTQQASLQFDANGYLKVNTAAGAAAGGTSSNFGSAFPTPGTAIGFTDGTNMVAARVGDVNNVAAATNYQDVLGIGRYNATQPTLTDTRFNALQVSSRGELLVGVGTTGFPVTVSGVATAANQTSVIGTKAPGTAATNSLLTGGLYNSGGVTLTDGQQASLQFTSTGDLKVVGTGIAIGSTTSGQTGSLVFGATTTAAPTYTTAQSNPLSLTTTGDLRTVFSNTTIAVTNAGTFVVQSTNAAETTKVIGTVRNLGNAGAIFDAATGAAPPANIVYTGANTSGATGGLVQGLIQCDSTAIYDASTNGSTELVALTSGRTIYVCGYSILAGGTVNVKLIYGTGTACATGSNNMTPAYQLTAQVGIVDGSPYSRGLKTASANALCLNTSAGIAAQAIVYYAKL